MVQSATENRTYYIRHIQRISFDVPVFCDPSIVRLHPRLDDHGLVHWSRLEVTPQPIQYEMVADENGNSVWQVGFHDLTVGLTLTVTSCVELSSDRALRRPPGRYATNSLASAYRRPHATMGGPIEALIQLALRASDGTKLSYLQRLTEILAQRLGIAEPPSHGVSIRDVSVETRLLLAATECLANAGRAQGIAARVVRGYEASDCDEIENDTRVWVEFYLDDLGWIPFDPLVGMIEQGDWIPLAKGATLQQTAPLSGMFRGSSRTPASTTQVVIRQAAVPV